MVAHLTDIIQLAFDRFTIERAAWIGAATLRERYQRTLDSVGVISIESRSMVKRHSRDAMADPTGSFSTTS